MPIPAMRILLREEERATLTAWSRVRIILLASDWIPAREIAAVWIPGWRAFPNGGSASPLNA
ncbi:MAG: hypothetical protein LC114_04110 [Bryobacterales bacterium]|nr:hypothetical protein [Bryobacterales bacterium]